MAVLQEGEAGVPVAEIIRKHGTSRRPYFGWKGKYAGATVADLKRLRELEAEDAKLNTGVFLNAETPSRYAYCFRSQVGCTGNRAGAQVVILGEGNHFSPDLN